MSFDDLILPCSSFFGYLNNKFKSVDLIQLLREFDSLLVFIIDLRLYQFVYKLALLNILLLLRHNFTQLNVAL
jgi:hypothetical protein